MLFVDLRLCFLNTSFENGDSVATLASGTAFLYVKDVLGFLDGENCECLLFEPIWFCEFLLVIPSMSASFSLSHAILVSDLN